MKTHQKLLAPIVLALVLGTTAYAGDMPCPPAPDPPPASAPATGGSENPTNAIPAPGSSAAPAVTDLAVDTTTLILNLLLGVLSIY